MAMVDIPEVRAMELESFSSSWQESAFYNELTQNPTAHYLVMRGEDQKLVGYAGFWLVQDEAHVTSIAIRPGHRGQQLGKRLMHAMVKRAADHGALWMTLEVRADNPAAQAMYKRFGFARVGVRPKYYDGTVDAWIMWAGNLHSESYRERLRSLDTRSDQHV
ncbi:MAG: ribosomal protein S18-alanine N-acetyltransferase [Candidatus Eremiobacteraeota bacterium]|nr:ribosomal protein S18-alanine N-acetyltransferase [Candidatus Eremiobacteraeota bacterium]